MKYIKIKTSVTKEQFLSQAQAVESFTSTNGKRYHVVSFNDGILKFLRLDGKKPEMEWNMNLNRLYQAYKELDDFSTEKFREYVPIQHSPARGLLLHLGLLEKNE